MSERRIEIHGTRQLICDDPFGDACAAHHPCRARQLLVHDVVHGAEDGCFTADIEALPLPAQQFDLWWSKDAVRAGATSLFMPHGLGHALGMDVHDMEGLGENFVGYDDKVQRSNIFGHRSLRFGKYTKVGNVLTVEPGIYFIPRLIEQWKAEGKFTDFINYTKLADHAPRASADLIFAFYSSSILR